MSLFFVAFSAVRDKRTLVLVSWSVVLTVFAVSLYGIGQKYLGFVAYLTMNEEFAKGIPLTLSQFGRVSSTFGGHYDLAAYLVFTLPIVISLLFGVRHRGLKVLLVVVAVVGAWVLALTVSRISLIALLVSLALILFFQKRKIFALFIPIGIVGLVATFVFAPRVLDRFTSTVKEIDVLVDAKTGNAIGHVKEVQKQYFQNTIVRQYFYDSITDVISLASPSAKFTVPYESLGSSLIILTEPTAPTGEDLPSGTGYINLTLSPVMKRLGNFVYEPKQNVSTTSAEAYIINGEYLVKRAYAYDLSFTTRFQGEWPKTIAAFKRNIFVGSGYGSVSLAVDNSYLRMLGEVGLFGFAAFLAILLTIFVFIRKVFPKVNSPVIKSIVWGYVGGVVGLLVNALFIDVFEASKVAFSLWLFTGAIMGSLIQVDKSATYTFKELKRMLISPYAVGAYLLLIVMVLFTPLTRNYFIGDDFTWFRWAADGGSIWRYFTDSSGFFYRPGTKMYFAFMYKMFWLNPSAYHTVSILLHFLVGALVFVLANKICKKYVLAVLSAFLFIVMSGFSEAVFWISATGHLMAAAFMLASVISYILWREHEKYVWKTAALTSFSFALLFHEMAVVTPLFFLAFEWVNRKKFALSWAFFVPIPLYGLMRLGAGSHWFSGDYSFNIVKFPLNAVGNLFGYIMLAITGPFGSSAITILRSTLKSHMVVSFAVLGMIIWFGSTHGKRIFLTLGDEVKKTVSFAALFTVISLLPFLGLGNTSPRYGYLAAVGMVMLSVSVIEGLYEKFAKSGRDVAIFGTSLIVLVFVLMQSVGLDKLNRDWHEAGEMVNKFLITIDASYKDTWASDPIEFYFVGVPIRHRDAWVFPVGITDALWFSFHNSAIRVNSMSSVESALDAVTYGSPLQNIFVFDSDGGVKKVDKPAPSLP